MLAISENKKLSSPADGLELSVLLMKPDAEEADCRGIVQIVHGMSEYKERYLPFMHFLAKHGYASIIHDHRGHGESVRSVEDYGYMYEAGTDAFLEDILAVNGLAREWLPGLPVIMLGHSMGSLAARSLMREHDETVDGLILSGAPCKNPAIGVAIVLADLQKKLFGGRHVAKLLNILSFMTYSGRFAKEGSRFAWINSDPTAVAAYDGDPACGFTFTVDGFQTLFALMDRTFKTEGWICRQSTLPIFFIAGAEDPCIENQEKFNEEVEFMRNVGYRNVESILYQGMRHEILNEPDRQKVFDDVLTYLEKYFGGKKE